MLVISLVVVTVAAAPGISAFAAESYQTHEAGALDAQVKAEAAAFKAQLARSVADGTPQDLLDKVAAQETQLMAVALPHASLWVDRLVLVALQHRIDQLRGLSAAVRGIEAQDEVAVHQQVLDALTALQADIQAAQNVSVASDEYTQFVSRLQAETAALATPSRERDLLAQVNAEDQKVKDATSAQVAAINALTAAKSSANRQLQRAQSLLAQAKSTAALKVDAYDSAISALATQVAQATATSQFLDLSAQLRAQADQLQALLNVRQSAYNLRDLARRRLARASSAGIDVTAETAQLAAASAALDAASDMPSLSAAHDQVQAAKNAIDVKYNLAVYGPGKVIVVSIQDQEMEVMQDGVVVLDTLVTTGRPALPTPPGQWTVTAKYTPYEMISPWPKGSPYYYNPSWVEWAMLFHSGGYFIHDAPWRTHYGPGSDSEFGGTHGCINVPHNQMSWLWGWTPVGTRVDVISGDF